ncbi:hypothetical protein K2Z84_33875 [Candidatus Binatia bacterium]|nr:hypothetical protein [Candidatus Binatia bacterium]
MRSPHRLLLRSPLHVGIVAGLILVLAAIFAAATVSRPAAAADSSVAAAPHAPVFRATGFFHTERRDRRWWLVTPDGRPFYANGIDHVTPSPDVDRQTGRCPYCDAIAGRYANLDEWAGATVARLQAWGFNTLGAWSDVDRLRPMPYTVLLDMAGGNDWFAPEFEQRCAAIAAGEVAARRDDPDLVGWYTDSELRWGPDWRKSTHLLDEYLQLPAGSPGRRVAERYTGRPQRFLRALAERYFKVTSAAIRARDPNHLILGSKMITQLTPLVLLRAARRHIDVFTFDDYTLLPGLDDAIQATWGPFVPRTPDFAAFYRETRKPIMIAEYSFRAADAGLPNTWPPIFPIYATQQDRADAYATYVEGLHRAPWMVGDFWFEFVDEPRGGRFDTEDSNFGVLTTDDEPWQLLVDRMTSVHASSPEHWR